MKHNHPPEVTKNTLVDYPRLDKLVEFLDETKDLPGDVAEVGVYKGGTAYLLASHTSKYLFLFDTFNGMPPVLSVDLHHEGDFADTSLEGVKELVRKSNKSNLSLHKGIFPVENSEVVEKSSFSLVHLDVDIYPSVKECLEFFTPRMVKGGIIVLDDYLEINCPGAKLAADEFAKENNLIIEPTVQSQAIIRIP